MLSNREFIISRLCEIELPGCMMIAAARKIIPVTLEKTGRPEVNDFKLVNLALDLYESQVLSLLSENIELTMYPDFKVRSVKATLFRGHFLLCLRLDLPEKLNKWDVIRCLQTIPWYESYLILASNDEVYNFDSVFNFDFVQACINNVTPDEILHIIKFANKRERSF